MVNMMDMGTSNMKNQLIPAFTFGEPNKPVTIAKDKASIKNSSGSILLYGDAEVRLDLRPNPIIKVYFTTNTEIEQINKLRLCTEGFTHKSFEVKLDNLKKTIKAPMTAYESSIVLSLLEPIVGVGDDSTEIQYVVFHLFNFKKIHQIGNTDIEHVNLKADNWIIELQSLPESNNNFEKLDNEGGCGITHIGKLEKVNNTPFTGKEAMYMLDALRHFLSFANGAWCELTCPVGFNPLGNRVWEYWSRPNSQHSEQSWFDEKHPEQLEDLFSGFMSYWVKENWRNTFHEVIYWYTNSNDSS